VFDDEANYFLVAFWAAQNFVVAVVEIESSGSGAVNSGFEAFVDVVAVPTAHIFGAAVNIEDVAVVSSAREAAPAVFVVVA